MPALRSGAVVGFHTLVVGDVSPEQGLGAGLLKDAIGRTLAVYAKCKKARSFYDHFGFRHSPSDPLHCFVLLKDRRERGVKAGQVTPPPTPSASAD